MVILLNNYINDRNKSLDIALLEKRRLTDFRTKTKGIGGIKTIINNLKKQKVYFTERFMNKKCTETTGVKIKKN